MKKRVISIILSVCMLISGISIGSLPTKAAETTNVALGKTAYASTDLSEWGAGASKLTDGDTNAWNSEFSSHTSTDEVSQWAAVDLDKAYIVNQVTLCTNADQGLPSEFSILAYNGSKWLEVYHGYGPGEIASGNPVFFDAVTCNAIKVVASRPSNRNGSYVFRLSELQVFGVESNEELQKPSFEDETTNVALASNETIITNASTHSWAEEYMDAKGYRSYNGDRAIDGISSYNTGKGYWYGNRGADKQTTPLGMTLSFKREYCINKISMEPAYTWTEYQGGFPEDFTIEALTDEGWKTVVERAGFVPNTDGTARTFYFSDVDCTAVRLTTSKNGAVGDVYGLNIGEVAVYGRILDETPDQYEGRGWYPLEGTEDIALTDMAYMEPTDGTSELVDFDIYRTQLFVDQDNKLPYAMPDCFKGALLLRNSMANGTKFEVVKAGDVYVLTPVSGTNSQKQYLEGIGFEVVSSNIEKRVLLDSSFEEMVLMKKSVAAGKEITIGSWCIVFSAPPSYKAPNVYTYPKDKTIIEKSRFVDMQGDAVTYGYIDGTRAWQGISGIEYIEYSKYEQSGKNSGGRLWATWYSGGRGEGIYNYVILATSDDEGETWTDARVIIDPDTIGEVRAFDPVLWTDPNGKMWIFWNQESGYTWDDPQKGVWAMYTENPYEQDPTWSKPVRLCNGVAMNKPTVIENANGEKEWLLCAYNWHEKTAVPEEYGPNIYQFVDYDKEWETFANINGDQTIVPPNEFFETMLVQNEDGSLRVVVRTAQGIRDVVSTDYGKTWSGGELMTDASGNIITTTVSRIHIRSIQDSDGKVTGKTQLMIYHNNTTGERDNLTAALSEDGGKTWPYKLILKSEPGCSYPDAVQISDGTIYITHDFERYASKQICYAKITVDDIKAGKIVSQGSKLGGIISQNIAREVEEEVERTNVAQGKTAYASTVAGNTIGNLTDGQDGAYSPEFSSKAYSDEVSQWVAVDLGKSYVVDEINLCTMYDQGLPSEFSVLAYDGNKWIEAYHGEGPGEIASGNPIFFEAVTCNAIKVVADRPSFREGEYGGYVFRLSELRVLGVESDEELQKPSFEDSATNVALSSNGTKITDVSIDDWAEYYQDGNEYKTYASDRVIDGISSYNTGKGYWYGNRGTDKQTTPLGITLSLKGTCRINKISLEPAYSWTLYEGGFPEAFVIEVLTDEGWKTVVERTGFVPNTDGTKKTFYFSDVDCTAVRLTTSKNGAIGDEYGLNVGEFEVYGIMPLDTDFDEEHTITHFDAIKPSCKAGGQVEYWYCSDCEGYWLDAACTMKTDAASVLLPKTDEHKEVVVKGKAPTCTKTGLTDGKKCSVCGVTTVAQKTIAKKGHKAVTVKGKAATCTKTGLTDGKKCSVCKTWITKQKVIPKVPKPGKSSITKLTGGKKQITVKFKKVKSIKGYEIQYATNKSMTKNKKVVTVKSSASTKVVKKLKTKTKYWVRIRTYKIVNGKKVYSAWSSKKTVKTK